MVVRVVAIYPGALPALEGLPGVRSRGRAERTYTQVECELATSGDVTSARPVHGPPSGTPPPQFRVQIEVDRSQAPGHGEVAAVVYPEDARGPADPEQRLLAPPYDNGRRLIFEFQRAEVIHATRAGDIHMRFVAVEPATERVGTVDRFHLNSCFIPLLARCLAHLEGTTDMFPAQGRGDRTPQPVPAGVADLTFGTARVVADRLAD